MRRVICVICKAIFQAPRRAVRHSAQRCGNLRLIARASSIALMQEIRRAVLSGERATLSPVRGCD